MRRDVDIFCCFAGGHLFQRGPEPWRRTEGLGARKAEVCYLHALFTRLNLAEHAKIPDQSASEL